jgi:hypothetical protein
MYVVVDPFSNSPNCIHNFSEGNGFQNTDRSLFPSNFDVLYEIGNRYEKIFVRAVRNYWIITECDTSNHARYVSFVE